MASVPGATDTKHVSWWDGLFATVDGAVTSLASSVGEQASKTFQDMAIKAEDDGSYSIWGWKIEWRQCVVLAGVAFAVILAVSAFFSGMSFFGFGYLIMIGLVLFLGYYLCQFLELKSINEVSQDMRAILIEVVDQIVAVFSSISSGISGEHDDFIRELIAIRAGLDKGLHDLGDHVDNIPAMLEEAQTKMAVALAGSEKTLLAYQQALHTHKADLRGVQEEIKRHVAELTTLKKALTKVQASLASTDGQLRERLTQLEGIVDSVISAVTNPAAAQRHTWNPWERSGRLVEVV